MRRRKWGWKLPSEEVRRALAIRKRLKRKKPDFVRQESWRYVRVKENWRRPRGIDSKMRKRVKGWPESPRIGYRGPKLARGLHPSGLREVLVFRVEELEPLNPEEHAVRISSRVGKLKRMQIFERAQELGLKVLNPPKT